MQTILIVILTDVVMASCIALAYGIIVASGNKMRCKVGFLKFWSRILDLSGEIIRVTKTFRHKRSKERRGQTGDRHEKGSWHA